MSTVRLLPFQQHILEQLTAPGPESDGLLLLARGLGLRNILCSFLETFAEEKSLVVLVNATAEEEQGLAEELGMRLTVIGYEMPAKERQAAYAKGGILSITTRILIIDMLLDRIPVGELTGLAVLHAEHVTPTSMEAFVMRVYREKNRHGFIKAFSDDPEAFTYGVAPLQTVLTQLHIRHVFLYPRFHELISSDLEPNSRMRKGDKGEGNQVLNLWQPMSESMSTIQTSIIECMDATLAELKRSNTVVEVEELTVQNALFRSFDAVIKAQLDPQWHKIGPKTRQLVDDLKTLRELLVCLLSFDAVSFNQYLETILASNTTNLQTGRAVTNQSPWLFLPAADVIFETARSRVYKKVAVQPDAQSGGGQTSSSGANGVSISQQSAEARPEQVARGTREQTEDGYWDDNDDSIFDSAEILAATQSQPSPVPATQSANSEGAGHNDAGNAAEMFSHLSDSARGKQRETETPGGFYFPETSRSEKEAWAYWCPAGTVPVLEEQPKWFLLREILEEIENQIHWSPVDFDQQSNNTVLVMCSSLRTVTTLRRYLSSIPELDRDATSPPPTSTGGRDLLLARASEYFLWKGGIGKMARNVKDATSATITDLVAGALGGPSSSKPNASNSSKNNFESAALKRKSAYKHGQPINKRRRVRGGAAGLAFNPNTRNKGSQDKKPAALSSGVLEAEAEELADSVAHEGAGVLPNSLQEPDEEFDAVAFDEYFGLCEVDQTIIIRRYAGDEDDRVLDELRPRFIVLYDPDPSYIRRIETYRSAHPGLKVQTYFMMYQNSAEEQRYLSHIRRERESFERLIRERSSMAIPLQAERRPNEDRADDFLRTVNSRVAGGAKHARTDPPKVVVDVREFRSSLPSLLHAAGFVVVPLTLTIGDYVLSPEMVVERKSLPDLMQSFASGRLYQQCEVMSTHYKIPILLIEFDQKKSFSLETYNDTRGNMYTGTDTDLQSKLVLLTLTFPRLRTIWSSSPYATADIFADLKKNRDEPDPEVAVAVGADDAASITSGETEAAVNQTPQEILRSLPGITTKNYSYVMRNVQNLEELAQMDLAQLNALIGVEAGRALHTFFNHNLLQKQNAAVQNTGGASISINDEDDGASPE